MNDELPICRSENYDTFPALPPGPVSLKDCPHLTLARAGEVVVILGHIGHDAETVGDTHRDHVTGVQESRDPQLLLSHFKGLGWGQKQPQQEEDEEARLVGTSRLRSSFPQRDPGTRTGVTMGSPQLWLHSMTWRSAAPGTSGPEGSRGRGRGAARV